ncbi:hypothetical protein ACKX2L_06130 [Lachnospiraceae bacterium YH-ros2228]
MKKKYILMHKNDQTASLILDDTTNQIEGYQSMQADKAPFLGTCDLTKIRKWWQMRAVPASRKTMQDMIRRAGYLDSSEYLAKNLAISVTDAYWICPINSNLEYEDVKLTNLTYVNVDKVPLHSDTSYDVNASLGGQMDKYWDLNFRPPVLVKKATTHFGQQAANEVFATILHTMQKTDIPFVSYRAERAEDGGLLCKCKAFTSDRKEFVPAYEVLHSEKIPNNVNYYQSYINICVKHGLDLDVIQRFMDYQTLTDFLLSNEDEHLCNFGVLRDPDTLEFLGPAPIFDSGNSMFYQDDRKTPYKRSELLKRPITSFYATEEKMLSNVKDANVVDLDRLPSIDQAMEFYTKAGLPEVYASCICQNYQTKVDMVHDLQSGKKLSFYNEKMVEKKYEEMKKEANSSLFYCLEGLSCEQKTEKESQLKQDLLAKGYRFAPENTLFPINGVDQENKWIVEQKKILDGLIPQQTKNQEKAFTMISMNEILREREAAGLSCDNQDVIWTIAFARLRQASLNGYSIIFSVPLINREFQKKILNLFYDNPQMMKKRITVFPDRIDDRIESKDEDFGAKEFVPPSQDDGWNSFEQLGDPSILEELDGRGLD